MSGLPRLARPLRVLLVEDDASIREALNKLVNTLGHRVHVTQNVREALDLAEFKKRIVVELKRGSEKGGRPSEVLKVL